MGKKYALRVHKLDTNEILYFWGRTTNRFGVIIPA